MQLFHRPLPRDMFFHGRHRSLEPVHTPVYWEIEPNEGKDEHTTEDNNGVVHILTVRVLLRWEEEYDRHRPHPGDRNKSAQSALIEMGVGRRHRLVLPFTILDELLLTHAPSENGPGVHPFSFLQIHREPIAIEYATYNAVTDMAKTALTACVPAKTSAPSATAPDAQNQTLLTGVLVYPFIR